MLLGNLCFLRAQQLKNDIAMVFQMMLISLSSHQSVVLATSGCAGLSCAMLMCLYNSFKHKASFKEHSLIKQVWQICVTKSNHYRQQQAHDHSQLTNGMGCCQLTAMKLEHLQR